MPDRERATSTGRPSATALRRSATRLRLGSDSRTTMASGSPCGPTNWPHEEVTGQVVGRDRLGGLGTRSDRKGALAPRGRRPRQYGGRGTLSPPRTARRACDQACRCDQPLGRLVCPAVLGGECRVPGDGRLRRARDLVEALALHFEDGNIQVGEPPVIVPIEAASSRGRRSPGVDDPDGPPQRACWRGGPRATSAQPRVPAVSPWVDQGRGERLVDLRGSPRDTVRVTAR